jgi:hypothetical protein
MVNKMPNKNIKENLDEIAGKSRGFEIGRSGDKTRGHKKGYENTETITNKMLCSNASIKEDKWAKHYANYPNYMGIGDARGSCPENGKQYVYVAWNKKEFNWRNVAILAGLVTLPFAVKLVLNNPDKIRKYMNELRSMF